MAINTEALLFIPEVVLLRTPRLLLVIARVVSLTNASPSSCYRGSSIAKNVSQFSCNRWSGIANKLLAFFLLSLE